MKKISIVLIIKNPNNLLLQIVETLLEAENIKELLIYNNGSYESLDLEEVKYKIENKQIRYVYQESKVIKPISEIYNWGIEACVAEYILFVEQQIKIEAINATLNQVVENFEKDKKLQVQGFVIQKENNYLEVLDIYLESSKKIGIKICEKELTQEYLESIPNINRECFAIRKSKDRFNEAYWYGPEVLEYTRKVLKNRGKVQINLKIKLQFNELLKKNFRQIESQTWLKRERVSYNLFANIKNKSLADKKIFLQQIHYLLIDPDEKRLYYHSNLLINSISYVLGVSFLIGNVWLSEMSLYSVALQSVLFFFIIKLILWKLLLVYSAIYWACTKRIFTKKMMLNLILKI